MTRYAVDGWNPALAGSTGNANFNVWADLDGSNDLQTRYLHGDQVDQLFARQDAGVQYWYLTDYQGSVRDVLDNSGNVKDAIVYDGFGNIISETNSAYRGSYAWTGRMFDVETGLQYNRARWYDPTTGRWQSQDPLGFDAGDSNLYRYVMGRPTILDDPSGLMPNQQDAITLPTFIKWVKTIETELTKTDENGKEIAPDPLDVLDAVTERLRGKTASGNGSGHCTSGQKSGSGSQVKGKGPFLNGVDSNWTYIYTKDYGWVDLAHFTYAALQGYTGINTYLGGVVVETLQFLAVFGGGGKGMASSAFTIEDIPSNQLGSDFRNIYFNRHEPLSGQLEKYLTSLGATDPQNAPDWNSLPATEKEWDDLHANMGYWERIWTVGSRSFVALIPFYGSSSPTVMFTHSGTSSVKGGVFNLGPAGWVVCAGWEFYSWLTN